MSAKRRSRHSLVLFEKYLLPGQKTHMRTHFVAIDQGYKMQPLAGFFTGEKVVFVFHTFGRLLVFL